ncbi:MAG: enoyl-CoA hydratase [Acidimicrobiia bacterium]|nr:MAG: enoyl-CoA hydratase [Acidimicrobiia bacterium]
MTGYRFLAVDLDPDGIARVTIDKPPINSLDNELYGELGRLLGELETDRAVRVVVFCSAHEKVFISGADIKDMADYDRRRDPLARKVDTVQAFFRRLAHFPKPTIAAICGHALGGGCEFALCVDFRVMTEGPARIGQPEVGLGIIPGGGGTQRLTRLVGRAKATEMLMLGERLSASEAQVAGLVHWVGRDEADTMALADDLARRLASQAPLALTAIKKVLNLGTEPGLDAGLEVEREAVLELLQSEDAVEGVRAFLEKRPPEWKGR